MNSTDYHQQFHDILGTITTIRSMVPVLIEDHSSHLTLSAQELLNQTFPKIDQLKDQVIEIKEQIYQDQSIISSQHHGSHCSRG